jgi:hypothetical protein
MLALVLIINFLLALAIAACVFLLWEYPHPRHELIFSALTALEISTPPHRKARFAIGVPDLRRAR